MKKIWMKLCLDAAMLVVLSLLFWKSNFGMEFHEIAGLAVLAAFVLHIILNWRWVLKVTTHLFQKNVTVRTRLGWVINAALFVCFLLIGLSGVFMSHVVFHFSVPGNWKTIHYFCSALVIVLVGIHLGLHLAMIGKLLSGRVRVKASMKKALLCWLTVLVAAVGVYSIPTTSFSMWVTMPFAVQGGPAGGERPDFDETERPERNSDENHAPSAESFHETTSPESLGGAEGETEGQESERPAKPEGGRDRGAAPGGSSPMNIIWKAVQYLSISLLFAIITRAVEMALKYTKTKKNLS